MTGHQLTITPLDGDTVTARCECKRWSLVAPDVDLAFELHEIHLAGTTPPPVDVPPPVLNLCEPSTRRHASTSRHVANHPAVRWARRNRTH